MFKYDEFFLGKDERCAVSTDCKKTQLNNNILVIGGSGSGKTSGIVNPMLLNLKYGNVVAVFAKKGASAVMQNILKERGYRVFNINIANPKNSEYGFDPLRYANTDSELTDLAHSIIYSSPHSEDSSKDSQYWNDSAKNLLDLFLKYVKRGYYKNGTDMSAVCTLMQDFSWPCSGKDSFIKRYEEIKRLQREEKATQEQKAYPERIYQGFSPSFKQQREEDLVKKREELEAQYPFHYELTQRLEKIDAKLNGVWRNIISLPDSTGGCVASSLSTPFENLFTAHIQRFLKIEKQFDIKELLQPKTAVFIYISPVQVSSYYFANIIYSQLFKTLFDLAEERESGELPYPVQFLCDDFAAGCPVNNFPNFISIFREKQISATMLIQSETQLASIYGEKNATTIINNCDTLIYLGGMDVGTCHDMSRRANLSFDKVQNMAIGDEIFIRRGMKPFMTKRQNFLEDPVYLSAIKKCEEEEEKAMSI